MDVVDLRVRASSNSRKRLRLERGSSSVGKSSNNRLSCHRCGKQTIYPEGESPAPPLVYMATFLESDSPTHPLFLPTVLPDPLVESASAADPPTTTSTPFPQTLILTAKLLILPQLVSSITLPLQERSKPYSPNRKKSFRPVSFSPFVVPRKEDREL
ncbi:hypothetical protein PVK06_004770 [Gossypium arboreum]|uniref:Uncharacterized protein n=1 Tax=Gossypium arboreum TaxID=29729 RepID=A0ABR0QU47_GOSAR|nr:hypothetical protein PVK06_004770 [Gossypium arboreum]